MAVVDREPGASIPTIGYSEGAELPAPLAVP